MQNQNLENGDHVDEKMYPYSNPSRLTKGKSIAMTLYNLVSFVIALVAIALYYIAVGIENLKYLQPYVLRERSLMSVSISYSSLQD